MRRRKAQPWYTDIRARLRFERGVWTAYPALRSTATGRGMRAKVTYSVLVDVPHFEPRRAAIAFANWTAPSVPRISVDGPEQSPHRYDDRTLCIWYPLDPEDRRWVSDDGLLALIDITRIHLFKEAYWRETGLWVGAEAPHAPPMGISEGSGR